MCLNPCRQLSLIQTLVHFPSSRTLERPRDWNTESCIGKIKLFMQAKQNKQIIHCSPLPGRYLAVSGKNRDSSGVMVAWEDEGYSYECVPSLSPPSIALWLSMTYVWVYWGQVSWLNLLTSCPCLTAVTPQPTQQRGRIRSRKYLDAV